MDRKEAEKKIEKLKDIVRRHDRLYYAENAPEVPDREYDRLYSELKGLEEKYPEFKADDSPTQRVSGEPLEGFQHVKHAIPMLSMDNTYSHEELRAFDGRVA